MLTTNTRYRFKERWRIEGELRTQSSLHVGDGNTIPEHVRLGKKAPEKKKDWHDIDTVARDASGKACIPGSALKGVLKSWGARRLPEYCMEVFGKPERGTLPATAGLAEFWDSMALPKPGYKAGQYWNDNRLTCVSPRTAIDRVYRTASEGKLFQAEVVPAGIAFQVNICGMGLDETQIKFLLRALEAFNEGEVLLGAHTASGFGRCAWGLTKLHRLTKNGVGAWIQRCGQGFHRMDELAEAEQARIVREARDDHFPFSAGTTAVFDIELDFQGPFLVNDPSAATKNKGDEFPSHAPVRYAVNGSPYLPATSFRGAFRSQAERIARTIGNEQSAGYPDSREYLKNFTVHSAKDFTKLEKCPVSRLFGSPGWRAPLQISDFCAGATVKVVEATQEFLAIDRFTGGGADGLKFNALAAYFPQFSGKLSLDLARLEAASGGERGLELLAYALRDLQEGDIRFGFGAAKGYGETIAKVRLTRPENVPERLRAGFQKWLGHLEAKA